MVCGSGMQAMISASRAIRSGDVDLVVAGGMESMSGAPYLVPTAARWGLRYGSSTLDDAMLRDALLDAYGEHEHMGLTGERIAHDLGLSRSDVDDFALRSHLRAAEANATGTFDEEIVPVPESATPGGHGLVRDEGPRGDTTLAGLARLRPSFRPGRGADGRELLPVVGRRRRGGAGERGGGRAPRSPTGGLGPQLDGERRRPERVMEAPIPTVRKHLEKVGLRPADFDRVEHNEAFASASIAVQRAFGFTDAQFNVHGGAVALGHPIGASGCRIVVTLVHELARAHGGLGLATLCMGGGNGLSLIVDRRGL